MAAVLGRAAQRGAEVSGVQERGCFHSPFFLYYTVVISLNAVAVTGGIFSQFSQHNRYGGGGYGGYGYNHCNAWQFTNAIYGVLHILAAFYIVRKIQEPEYGTEAAMELPQHQQPQQDVPQQAQPVTMTKQQSKQQAKATTKQQAKQDPSMDYQLHQPAETGLKQQDEPAKQKRGWFGKKKKQVQPEPIIDAEVVAVPVQTFGPPTGKTKSHVDPDLQQYQPPVAQQQPPVQQPQSHKNNNRVVRKNAQKSLNPPNSMARIKHVMLENYVVAIYMLIYIFYLLWHFWMERYPCNRGMAFAMRTADIFVIASPCAFVFCVIKMLMDTRQL